MRFLNTLRLISSSNQRTRHLIALLHNTRQAEATNIIDQPDKMLNLALQYSPKALICDLVAITKKRYPLLAFFAECFKISRGRDQRRTVELLCQKVISGSQEVDNFRLDINPPKARTPIVVRKHDDGPPRETILFQPFREAFRFYVCDLIYCVGPQSHYFAMAMREFNSARFGRKNLFPGSIYTLKFATRRSLSRNPSEG